MSRIRENPEYQAFSDALRADNLNPLTWNIFADWLEDNGAPLRAKLLRLRSQSIELTCLYELAGKGQWHELCHCVNCNRHRQIKQEDRELCQLIQSEGE